MTKRVLLLLADGFEPLEAAGFTDVLGWANIEVALALLTDLTSEKTSEQIRALMRVPRPALSWWTTPQVPKA